MDRICAVKFAQQCRVGGSCEVIWALLIFSDGGGETTGEVEEAQSILFSAFVCIGSLLGVWWICSHHALSVLLLVGGFMHEALKVWISRLLEKSYKDRQGHKVKEKAVNIFLFCVVGTVELGHVLHLLLCLWAPPPIQGVDCFPGLYCQSCNGAHLEEACSAWKRWFPAENTASSYALIGIS